MAHSYFDLHEPCSWTQWYLSSAKTRSHACCPEDDGKWHNNGPAATGSQPQARTAQVVLRPTRLSFRPHSREWTRESVGPDGRRDPARDPNGPAFRTRRCWNHSFPWKHHKLALHRSKAD